jgi:hypothetical protein
MEAEAVGQTVLQSCGMHIMLLATALNLNQCTYQSYFCCADLSLSPSSHPPKKNINAWAELVMARRHACRRIFEIRKAMMLAAQVFLR